MSKYLISGIRGQDGRIAASLLSKQGHTVAGLTHTSEACSNEIDGCTDIWWWDWLDELSLTSVFEDFMPDCVIHFAASHIASSKNRHDIEIQKHMFLVNLAGLEIMLRSLMKVVPKTIFINAASSQIYSAGRPGEVVNELSKKLPKTFYGYTKLSGVSLVDYYRREQGLKGGSAILFNHESYLRCPSFVSRKISKAAAEIKRSRSNSLHLKNIGALADMSSAFDVVKGTLLMGEKNNNSDYILSSFKSTSILDLVKFSFEHVNLDYNDFVTSDQRKKNNFVIGDNTLSKNELDWFPQMNMKSVMQSMVEYDLAILNECPKFFKADKK